MAVAKVQIIQSISGTAFAWQPGQVVDMPDDEAAKWADGERGVLAADDAVVHQTYDPAAEPVAEVVVVEEPDEVAIPEPHGYFPPEQPETPEEAGDEPESPEDVDGPETPESAGAQPETPEAPTAKRGRAAKGA